MIWTNFVEYLGRLFRRCFCDIEHSERSFVYIPAPLCIEMNEVHFLLSTRPASDSVSCYHIIVLLFRSSTQADSRDLPIAKSLKEDLRFQQLPPFFPNTSCPLILVVTRRRYQFPHYPTRNCQRAKSGIAAEMLGSYDDWARLV